MKRYDFRAADVTQGESEDGEFVRYEDVAALEAENEALRAEVNSLEAQNAWLEENRKVLLAEIRRLAERLKEPWGAPSRFQPLIAQPGEVRFLGSSDRALSPEEVEKHWKQWVQDKPLSKVLSAQEITEPGWYWWRWSAHGRWNKDPQLVVQLEDTASCHAIFRFGLPSGDVDLSKVFTGQFVGPLPAPEV